MNEGKTEEKPECGVLRVYAKDCLVYMVVPDECKEGYSKSLGNLEPLGVRVIGEAEADDSAARLRKIEARLAELKRQEEALQAERAARRKEEPQLTEDQIRRIARQEAQRAAEAIAVAEDEAEEWEEGGEEFDEDEFSDLKEEEP